jgi:hypothetical protein
MKTQTLSKAIALVLLPGVVAAQAPTDSQKWDVRAAVYGYFPDIGGTTRFPVPGGEFEIQSDDLVHNTELAGMAAVEAQKGRVGLFADAIYMDVGDEIVGSTTLGQGTLPLPPGITADAALDVEATVFTIAANFRVANGERNMFDAFAGIRSLTAEGTLDATLNSPFGPVAAIASTPEGDSLDAIVGVKGKLALGTRPTGSCRTTSISAPAIPTALHRPRSASAAACAGARSLARIATSTTTSRATRCSRTST